MHAERAYLVLRDEGVSPEMLLQAARDYAAQIEASGREVLSPANFFGKGDWRGPFPLPDTPESRAKAIQAKKIEVSWNRVKAHAAAISCPLEPYQVDSPDSFETRVRAWELKSGSSAAAPGLKSVANHQAKAEP